MRRLLLRARRAPSHRRGPCAWPALGLGACHGGSADQPSLACRAPRQPGSTWALSRPIASIAALPWQRATEDLNHRPLPYQESSHASDVLRLVVELSVPSVNVHRRPLAVATIVTQLVTQAACGCLVAVASPCGVLSYRLCAEFSWGPSRQSCSWQLVPAPPTHWESAGFACAAVVWRHAGANARASLSSAG